LPSENKEGVLICNLIKTSPHFDLHSKSSPPLFFTWRKLHPPGIGIEATGPYLSPLPRYGHLAYSLKLSLESCGITAANGDICTNLLLTAYKNLPALYTTVLLPPPPTTYRLATIPQDMMRYYSAL